MALSKYIPFITADNKQFQTVVSTDFLVEQNVDGYIDCYLYYNKSDYNVVNKNLEHLYSTKIVLKDETSLVTPVIELYLDLPADGYQTMFDLRKMNYCHLNINGMARYYFIVDVISNVNNVWTLLLKEDVLKTYWAALSQCECFISRSETNYDNDLTDNKVLFKEGFDVEDIDINNNVFIDPDTTSTTDYKNTLRFVINGYKIGVGYKDV